MSPKKQVSARDIARLSGVSVATVSRVINQNGRFSKETERRVREIIAKHNYQPNHYARSLRTRKVKTVGVLVPDITNEYFAHFALELQKELMQLDYITLICNTDETPAYEENHLNSLKAQRVGGIIFIACDSVIKQKSAPLIPTVYIDRKPAFNHLGKAKYVCIESDNDLGGYLAGKELIENGCKKPAIVRDIRNISTAEGRFNGFKQALEENNIHIEDKRVIPVENVSIEEGYLATEYLMDKIADTDGIFFTSDLMAIGGIRYANEKGVNIPSRLRIVGFDDINMSKITHPKLTTVHQDVVTISNLAVKMLMKMINGEEPDSYYHRVPVKLIQREST